VLVYREWSGVAAREGTVKRQRNLRQLQLLDPWEGTLGARTQRLLEQSWAGTFREVLLPALPVELLADLYAKGRGRPGKDLHLLLAAVLLQQFFDLSDEEAVLRLATDATWHYALNLPQGLFDDQAYVCERTLWTARNHLAKKQPQGFEGADDGEVDAVRTIFETLTDQLAEVLGLDATRQRIDGTHVMSNMAKLGRVRILFRVIRDFLRELRSEHPRIFAKQIDASMIEAYLETKRDPRVKPSASAERLESLAHDAAFLVAMFREHRSASALSSFSLLARAVEDQCEVEFAFDEQDRVTVRFVEPRPGKEVDSGSLQNPSDADATYSGHKGQGYTAVFSETFSPDDEEDGDVPQVQLITAIELIPANEHESSAVEPLLESLELRGLTPDEWLGDTHFGSDELVMQAKAREVELIAPVPGDAHPSLAAEGVEAPEDGASRPLTIADFTFADATGELDTQDALGARTQSTCDDASFADHRVSRCPGGFEPIEQWRSGKHKQTLHARFSGEHCANCPLKDRCPTKPVSSETRRATTTDPSPSQQNSGLPASGTDATEAASEPDRVLTITANSYRLTFRRRWVASAEFRETYRWRAGIEASNARYKQGSGADRLNYRGYQRVRLAAIFKAFGENLRRATAARAATSPAPGRRALVPNGRTTPKAAKPRRAAKLHLLPQPGHLRQPAAA